MPKGVEKQQLANSGVAQGLSNQLTANAANIYGGLEPILASQAAHPAGFTPTQKASINTAAQQSAGGTNAGAVGQGGLYAARTRNAGAGQAAIGASSRSAGANLSKSAVGTEVQDADLAQQNRNRALGGLQGLYGEELTGGEHALGLSNQALEGADKSSSDNIWNKILLQSMSNAQKASEMGAGG